MGACGSNTKDESVVNSITVSPSVKPRMPSTNVKPRMPVNQPRGEYVADLKKIQVKHDVDRPSITINQIKYTIIEKIGQGGFGVVYKATYNGNEFAIKQMIIDASNAESVIKEVKFIVQISSGIDPKVLPLIRVFGIEMIGNSIFMVMELALCDLNDLVETFKSKGQLNKRMVDVVFAFVLKALVFLYENETVHGDIKFQNFVVLEDKSSPLGLNVKLIDFGTINQLDKNVSKIQLGTVAGTLLYLAPEQLNGTVHKKTDIWALGVMLYYMVFSDFPGYVQDQKSIVSFLQMPNDLNVPRPPAEFEVYRKVIQMCLVKDVDQRASAKDLYSVLPRIMDQQIIEQVIGKNIKVYESPEVLAYMRMKRSQLSNKQVARQATKGQCRVCSKSLPPSHQYNRCDECFRNRSKKCIICGKVLINYKFSRCGDCFQKTKHLDKKN